MLQRSSCEIKRDSKMLQIYCSSVVRIGNTETFNNKRSVKKIEKEVNVTVIKRKKIGDFGITGFKVHELKIN